MSAKHDVILLVESNPDISDLIANQTLRPFGYRVEVVKTAAAAIQNTARLSPELIIVNLNLPGLSGKDYLVALSSQGLDIPVIVLSEKGMESDVIQAFRLGASDYILWPAREAEVISAVERVLKQIWARKEREDLARQLNKTNQELHRRVRELTTIFAIGKAVTSITDQNDLFKKIIEGAIYISEADLGWLLLREGDSKVFTLRAHHKLPDTLAEKLNQPWDDGISSLVSISGESLAIHGDPLKRFKVSRLGRSILAVPVKIQNEVVALLVVVRKASKPFGPNPQALLESMADYASISIVNARLFRALEERARSLQDAVKRARASEHSKDEMLNKIQQELFDPLSCARTSINALINDPELSIDYAQRNLIGSAQDKLLQMSLFLAHLTFPSD
ncbi:MAG: response regulator [Anaerolineales bacterium]|jgi:two-component system NtrC family sensor kinase